MEHFIEKAGSMLYKSISKEADQMFKGRPDGTRSARVIQVIETKADRGLGTNQDPVREVTQYWDLDGNFLAEMDTELCMKELNKELGDIGESIEPILKNQ